MRIHALTVDNGILALCGLPGRDGDYAGDMEHIRGWAPAMVLTLTTEVELFTADAGQLGSDIQSRGMRWFHLPIPDMGIPGGSFEEHWTEVSRIARRALRGGGRVLVHCKAGCGRSGMVALRLMLESGAEAHAALTRLRRVRPCAIETEDQLRWAVTLPPPPEETPQAPIVVRHGT